MIYNDVIHIYIPPSHLFLFSSCSCSYSCPGVVCVIDIRTYIAVASGTQVPCHTIDYIMVHSVPPPKRVIQIIATITIVTIPCTFFLPSGLFLSLSLINIRMSSSA